MVLEFLMSPVGKVKDLPLPVIPVVREGHLGLTAEGTDIVYAPCHRRNVGGK